MFKSWSKSRDMITLFHKPSSPASSRVLTLMKQAAAMANSSATEDQASDHTTQNKAQRSNFDIEITEELPTRDQLTSIIDYVPNKDIGKVVKGAKGLSDALKKFEEDGQSFRRPVVVDWNNGTAVASEDESEILKLVNTTVFWKDE